MMMDRNSDHIAGIIQLWMRKHGLVAEHQCGPLLHAHNDGKRHIYHCAAGVLSMKPLIIPTSFSG